LELCLGDRVEMASSIEGRTPLLDSTFADFVLRLPIIWWTRRRWVRREYCMRRSRICCHRISLHGLNNRSSLLRGTLFKPDAGQEFRTNISRGKGLTCHIHARLLTWKSAEKDLNVSASGALSAWTTTLQSCGSVLTISIAFLVWFSRRKSCTMYSLRILVLEIQNLSWSIKLPTSLDF
jgi:hypothetical protein